MLSHSSRILMQVKSNTLLETDGSVLASIYSPLDTYIQNAYIPILHKHLLTPEYEAGPGLESGDLKRQSIFPVNLLCACVYSACITSLNSRNNPRKHVYYSPHFIDKKPETQPGKKVCFPGFHS